MAKYCAICGKKFGLRDGKIGLADGLVCTSCWASAGFDMGFKAMLTCGFKTTKQVQNLIEIETLKNEMEKTKLKEQIASAESENVSDEKAEKQANSGTKPVDIIIEVDKNKNVSFVCQGQPVINFEDLVNGKELIIGDGYVRNEDKIDLPDIRIGCEFDPPVADPGFLFYESGTFAPGEKVRFEIDDPPVNLEEYAKVKKTRNGKIRFTLFFGEKEMTTLECDMKVKPAPQEDIQRLISAVTYEQEKNASGPVNIFLYARDNGRFKMDLMRHPELLYSLYANNQEQLIGDVFVSNESAGELINVQFEAKFASDILSPVKVLLGNVAAGENLSFEVDDPAIDVDKLEALTEIETCIATYTLRIDGKIVAESTGKIAICPYDQWNGAMALLPAYMMPNHPNVVTILQNASKWMQDNNMNPSLEGYQGDTKRVEEMVKGVYNAVRAAGIVYSNPPASFFGPQRIRLCGEIFSQKFATCLDMTILFASCLESFGLNPVLITAPGHIFAGVWLNGKGRLQEPVISDAKLIRKFITDGSLAVLECTAMNAGNDKTYEEAKGIAIGTVDIIVDNNIQDHECIDVQILRAVGIRPLPIRTINSKPSYASEIRKGHETEEVKNQNNTETVKENDVEPAEPTNINAVKSNKTYVTEEYAIFQENLSHISIENFYDKQTKKILKDAITEIVATEGPISQPALIRTLINSTDLGRAGRQIAEHLDKLVAAASVKITRESGVRYLWNYGTNPEEYLIFRTKEQRNPEDICKYELKNAVCYLIQENGPMTKVELTKAMVKLLGYGRSSKKLEDGAAAAIRAARELKAIELNEKKQYEIT